MMGLDTKHNTQPPFVFTQTSIGFLQKRESGLAQEKVNPKRAFKHRNMSVGIERDFISENVGKIHEYDFMSAIKNGKKINGILNQRAIALAT